MSWFLLGISLTFNIIAFAIYKQTFDKLKRDIDDFKKNYKG